MATKVDVAELNRAAWSGDDAVAEFVRLEGFIDAGERVALIRAADRVRGQPTLDVGVGAGRTVSLLRLITDDYVGIDYTPAMIAAARRRHPGIDIRESDARRLDGFAADHFGFVFFSFSGIDAVNHEDRPRVLSELFRVLRPDGWLLFSTHNMVGPSYREVPWRGYAFPGSRWYRTFRWAARLPMNLPRYLRRWRNWLRNRGLSSASKDWAMRIAAPHDFGIVIHYVTLAGLFGELTAAGFADIEVISSEDGRAIADCDLGQVNAFYVLARKAAVRR